MVNVELTGPARFRLWPVVQTSTCSASAIASSTSMPRYLTVLSILVWPSISDGGAGRAILLEDPSGNLIELFEFKKD